MKNFVLCKWPNHFIKSYKIWNEYLSEPEEGFSITHFCFFLNRKGGSHREGVPNNQQEALLQKGVINSKEFKF